MNGRTGGQERCAGENGLRGKREAECCAAEQTERGERARPSPVLGTERPRRRIGDGVIGQHRERAESDRRSHVGDADRDDDNGAHCEISAMRNAIARMHRGQDRGQVALR